MYSEKVKCQPKSDLHQGQCRPNLWKWLCDFIVRGNARIQAILRFLPDTFWNFTTSVARVEECRGTVEQWWEIFVEWNSSTLNALSGWVTSVVPYECLSVCLWSWISSPACYVVQTKFRNSPSCSVNLIIVCHVVLLTTPLRRLLTCVFPVLGRIWVSEFQYLFCMW
jgi:hypothetical protein